jgi:hypothetical protein
MTTARRDLVIRVAFLLVGAHVLAIVAKIEQWPLSHYPMYSHLQGPEISNCVLFGVTSDGSEVRLQKYVHWAPFGANRFRTGLGVAKDRDQRGRERSSSATPVLPGAVAQALNIYDRNRAAGLHDGPPLVGLRLYEATWRLDRELKNLDQPEQRTLLVDYVRDR